MEGERWREAREGGRTGESDRGREIWRERDGGREGGRAGPQRKREREGWMDGVRWREMEGGREGGRVT